MWYNCIVSIDVTFCLIHASNSQEDTNMKRIVFLVEVDGETDSAADIVAALQNFGFKTAKVLGIAAMREEELPTEVKIVKDGVEFHAGS